MFGLPVVEDTRAKGSYGTFCIKSDGQFVGFKFGPHKRVPFFANADMRNCLQFFAMVP